MIRKYENSDLTACAQIMMEVYNNDLWQCRWSLEPAKCYLQDFVNHAKFIGYTLLIDNEIKGAKLILRTAKKGDNAGQQFYGCTAFPKCRYISANL